MKTTKKTKLDYKLLTNIHDDLSKLASRITWRQENLEDRKSHLEGVTDQAERTKLQEGIKRSESVLNNLVREYNLVSSKLVVGQSEQLAAIFEKMNRHHITMLEIGDYDKLAKEMLSS